MHRDITATMFRRGNHQKSQKRLLTRNQAPTEVTPTTVLPTRVEGHESRSPISVTREALLDRATQSLGPDTLDGGSAMPSRPPSPLQNHDKMDSGPCYWLKIMVYKTTHKGRRPLPAKVMDTQKCQAYHEG